MYRGTTPTFTFNLPIEADTITKLNVTFKQGITRFEKGLADVEKSGKTLTVSLSEEDTLQLIATKATTLSIRLRIGVGELRMASQIFTVPVEEILKEGVL